MKKYELDAREMEHPVPLEKGTSIIKGLDNDSYLYMIHRKNPVPLIEMARGWGMQVLDTEDCKGIWHILIAKNLDIDLNELLYV